MRTKAGTICCLGVVLLLGSTSLATAQQQAPAKDLARNVEDATKHPTGVEEKAANGKRDETITASPGFEERLKAMEQLIERHQREIQALRDIVEKKGDASAIASPADAAQPQNSGPQLATAAKQAPAGKGDAQPSDTQKKVDELYKKFGAIRFSGDLRFRVEPFRNQGFDALADSPDRNRLRMRARLAGTGKAGKASPADANAPRRNSNLESLGFGREIFNLDIPAPQSLAEMLIVLCQPALCFFVLLGDESVVNFERCCHSSHSTLPQKPIGQPAIDGNHVASGFREPRRNQQEDRFCLILWFDGRLCQRALCVEGSQLVAQVVG